MAKNTNGESAGTTEPTVTVNRKKLVTAGWIAGGVVALGATFAAGAAFGDVIDGPRGGDHHVVGSTGMTEGHGPQGGPHDGPHAGDRDGDRGMGDGPHRDKDGDRPLGDLQYEGEADAPADGSTTEGTFPAPPTAP